MASNQGDANSLVAASDEAAEAPSWELRMLLERAAELEALQRFEEALVLYHRGRRRAPLVAAFREGVERSEKAVQSVIGTGAAPLFDALPDLLPGMIEEQREARGRERRAARTAHRRLQDAVRNMTFAETQQRPAPADDADGEVCLQVAVVERAALSAPPPGPRLPRRDDPSKQ